MNCLVCKDLLPHDGVLGGLVLGLALHAYESDAGGVQGRRDPDLDLLRQQGSLKVGLDDDLHLELAAADLAHKRDHTERKRDILRCAIP